MEDELTGLLSVAAQPRGDHVALPASRASTLADPSGQSNSFAASASMRGDLGERIAAMYYGVELVWA